MVFSDMQCEERKILFWDVSVKSRILMFIECVTFCWNQGSIGRHAWFLSELISAWTNSSMIVR